jgi:hypothetical protein
LLGLVSACEIVDPDPAEAPVIPPLTVPIVQVNVEGADEVNAMFVVPPLQMEAVFKVVTTGVGFTVKVIVVGEPAQAPPVEVGVTIYSTEPAVALPGLVRVWLILPPLPADAPVMLPVIVPIVHAKVLAALAASVTFGALPLQTEKAVEVVITGLGLTVNTIVSGVPAQPFVEVGVIMYSTDPAVDVLGLVSAWLRVPPDPAEAPVMPPVIVPIVQLYVLVVEDVNVTL